MSKVEILVGSKIYGGWKDVQIRRSIKAISGAFALSVTDQWSGQLQPWIVKPGDSCELRVNGETVITGYIDAVSPSFTATSREIEIAGRDKTADMVDCSANIGSFELLNIRLEDLAKRLARQFGLSVSFSGSSGSPIDKVSINPGDTGFDVLEKAARQKGFLITTDGKGKILVTRPGTTKAATALEQGKNILTASASYDFTERFSDYKAISQFGELAQELGTAAYSVEGSARDEAIKRSRLMLISAENSLNGGDARKRAQWEATVRAARSSKFKCSVAGWEQADGSLWRPNLLVPVKSAWLGLEGDLLITSVSLSMSESGTIAELELERPDAYIAEPVVKSKTDPLAAAVAKDLAT